MKEGYEKLLERSVFNTFRDMAALEVIPQGELSKEVNFTNVFGISSAHPEEIRLDFLFPLEMKKKIIESVIKSPWEETSSQYIDDCLLEVVNIIGGNFFCQYFSPESYEIGLPYLNFDNHGLTFKKMYFYKIEDILFSISLS